MKEYIEREALEENLRESYNGQKVIYACLTDDDDKNICAGQLATLLEAIFRVKEAPAADVVEVVRCKDCKYYIGVCCVMTEGLVCPLEEWYCSHGERREDE